MKIAKVKFNSGEGEIQVEVREVKSGSFEFSITLPQRGGKPIFVRLREDEIEDHITRDKSIENLEELGLRAVVKHKNEFIGLTERRAAKDFGRFWLRGVSEK